MAKTTITIDSSLKKGSDWYNITHNGKPLGINVKSNPKSIAAIDGGALTLELNVNESKDGTKYYGFDLTEQRQGGGGGFRKPVDPEAEALKQRMIIAQSCLSSACTLWNQGSKSAKEITDLAKEFYNWVLETSK